MTTDTEQANKALEMVRDVYEDGEAEINGRTYQLTKTNHKKRRKVFAFTSKIGPQMQRGDFSWMDSPEFASVEETINNIVMFDGDLLSRRPDHWDEYPEDYMIFIPTVLGAISYPFMKGAGGG